MNQNEERNARAQLECFDKTLPLELSAEFALPDYKSEISRLLRIQPTLLPPARFVGKGKAELSGSVQYEVLYAGPDGKLYSAETEDHYAFSVPLDGITELDAAEGVELDVELVPDAVIGRVTSPRKLSVRCRLHALVRGYAVKSLGEQLPPECDCPVERLCDCVECGRVYTGGHEAVDLADRFSPEAGESMRVISARGQVFLPEVTAVAGAVLCRGEAVVTLLCCDEEKALPPFTLTRRIPFEREVVLEGADPSCRARATGVISELRTSAEEDGLQIGAVLTLSVEAQRAEPILLTRDLYVPGYQSECRMGEHTLWQPMLCTNRHFSVAAEAAPAELGVPDGAAVIDAVADGEIKGLEGNMLVGEVHCHVLYGKEGEYGTAQLTIPFRTALGEGTTGVSVSCRVPLVHARREHDRLRADAEVLLSLRSFCHTSERCVGAVTLGEACCPPRADLEICYPGKGESLWGVGKRYGVSPTVLATANGLDGEAPGEEASLAGVKYLLIP